MGKKRIELGKREMLEQEGGMEVVNWAQCGCCGMWEECTVGYMEWVKGRFGGVWVCGLCQEAIKDEQVRLGVGIEVALRAHATFRETVSQDPALGVARSVLNLLKKFISSSSSSAPKDSNGSSPSVSACLLQS